MTTDKNENCDSNSLLLDSKHIITTLNYKLYDIKVVNCGDYSQIYMYESKKRKQSNDYSEELKLKKKKAESLVVTEEITKTETQEENKKTKEEIIEARSIIRSKLECQRLAKCNIKDWKTFITLTFSENIEDIELANKKFRYFIDKVQRVYKNFKYISIPEFQKRGAVHYHLLCNIEFTNSKLLYEQKDNPKFKHIKYWNEGFTSIEEIKGDVKKIIGYISKYMTKDIDNRLFNHRRYYYSRNLEKPQINYIDFDNEKEINYYKKIIQEKQLIYENNYVNQYNNENVTFLEYLKK